MVVHRCSRCDGTDLGPTDGCLHDGIGEHLLDRHAHVPGGVESEVGQQILRCAVGEGVTHLLLALGGEVPVECRGEGRRIVCRTHQCDGNQRAADRCAVGSFQCRDEVPDGRTQRGADDVEFGCVGRLRLRGPAAGDATARITPQHGASLRPGQACGLESFGGPDAVQGNVTGFIRRQEVVVDTAVVGNRDRPPSAERGRDHRGLVGHGRELNRACLGRIDPGNLALLQRLRRHALRCNGIGHVLKRQHGRRPRVVPRLQDRGDGAVRLTVAVGGAVEQLPGIDLHRYGLKVAGIDGAGTQHCNRIGRLVATRWRVERIGGVGRCGGGGCKTDRHGSGQQQRSHSAVFRPQQVAPLRREWSDSQRDTRAAAPPALS